VGTSFAYRSLQGSLVVARDRRLAPAHPVADRCKRAATGGAPIMAIRFSGRAVAPATGVHDHRARHVFGDLMLWLRAEVLDDAVHSAIEPRRARTSSLAGGTLADQTHIVSGRGGDAGDGHDPQHGPQILEPGHAARLPIVAVDPRRWAVGPLLVVDGQRFDERADLVIGADADEVDLVGHRAH